MLERLVPTERRPTGWRRWLLNLPLLLDSLHLNRLLGPRFVVIVHRGRRSEAAASNSARGRSARPGHR